MYLIVYLIKDFFLLLINYVVWVMNNFIGYLSDIIDICIIYSLGEIII